MQASQINTFPVTIAQTWADRCRKSPEAIFLIADGQQYTYRAIDELAHQVGKQLWTLGVRERTVLGLELTTSPLYVALILGCLKLGATVLPLNPHLDQCEADHIIAKLAPTVILVDQPEATLVKLADDGEIDYARQTVNVVDTSLVALVAQHQVLPPADAVSDFGADAAVILCTSGTTSYAKGSVLSHRNVLYSELQFNRIYGITADDVLVLPSGFYHAIGFHHGLIGTILAGSTLVLMAHYSQTTLRQLIRQWHCTYVVTVPTIVYDLLQSEDDPGSLRCAIVGGALVSASLLTRAQVVGLPVYNIYGLTECVPFLCTDPAYYAMHHGFTVAGYPIAGTHVRLVNSVGQTCGSREMGEIWVKGPTVFQGYYHDPEETAQALDPQGWFHTGDLGHFTSDGGLLIDGRIKDTLIRGGENIPAPVVEDYLRQHPAIAEAAVVGLPDPRLGERIGAYIVMQPKHKPLTLAQVLTFFATRGVEKKFWPEALFVVGSLPKTATGKVRKYLLQQNRDEA